MNLFTLLSVGFSASTLAAAPGPALYDTKMSFMVAGEEKFVNIMGEEGKAISFERKDDDGIRRLEMIAREEDRGRVHMKFRLSYESKDGLTRISSSPRIIAREGEAARIEVASKEGGAPEFSVSVVTRRVEY